MKIIARWDATIALRDKRFITTPHSHGKLEEAKEVGVQGTMSGQERSGLGHRRRGQGTTASGGRRSLSLIRAFLKDRRTKRNSWNFRKHIVLTITTVLRN
jgi:hypothetical protein